MTSSGRPVEGPGAAHPPEGTAIAVTAHAGPRSLLGVVARPRIVVDGQEQPGRWGRTVTPVPPGPHEVQVYVPFLLPRRRGPARVRVSVPAGEPVELEYWPPLLPFLPGSLGPPPQVANGAWLTVALVAGGFLLACLALSVFARTS